MWGSLNLLVFIKISSIIKPEKILLLKPVNLRGDYPLRNPAQADVERLTPGIEGCAMIDRAFE
nr:hypothetical protein [Rhizobium sp. Root1203]